MADLRFEDKNNQKKAYSIFSSGVLSTSATMDDTLFTLPEASMVLGVYLYVETASGVALSTVDVKVGSVLIADEASVASTGFVQSTNNKGYFPTGGSVTIVAGATAPDTAGRLKVVVEYIETELASGTYTD